MIELPGTFLVIEPSKDLVYPYAFLHGVNQVTFADSVDGGISELKKTNIPDVVMISASFRPAECVMLLDAVKRLSATQLIPVIIVVNLNQPISYIPGTTWGGQFGIIHTQSSKAELLATLERIVTKDLL